MVKYLNEQGDQRRCCLIQVDEIRDNAASMMQQYSLALHRIKQLLEECDGWQFTLYTNEDDLDELWEIVEQDIRLGSKELEAAAQIYETLESRAFTQTKDGDQFHVSLTNQVFEYRAFGVALAKVPVMRQYGIGHEDVLLAIDDQLLHDFLQHMRKRRRALDREQVTLFTDEHDGVARELVPITTMVERDEVILNDELKKEIYRSIDRFFEEDRSFFTTFNIPYKRGILLYGKPGNGKTTLVKSIAASVKAPVAYWQITEHTSSSSIQEVFEAAANLAPMILVVEDIDSMPERVRSHFLNTLDGATSKEGIFLIGTTNYPEKIDPALMNRAGRFDRAYELKLPDLAQRSQYLRHKGMQRMLADREVDELAKLTEGFSFAQLNELYVSAALEWHEEQQVQAAQLVKRLKADLHKGKTQEWFQDHAQSRVGFAAM